MPKYVLHYFGARARGELIRLVLTLAGQDFEDHRFTFEEWPKLKSGFKSGQVPVLEVDGKMMNESLAIAKYIAREYGFGGKNNLEQYYIDRILGACTDLFQKFVEIYFEKDKEKQADLQKKMDTEHIPHFLGLFTYYLEEGSEKSDFFVGKSGTLADLAVHDLLTSLILKDEKLLDKFPKLKANRAATEALPNIKAYLDKRPKSDI